MAGGLKIRRHQVESSSLASLGYDPHRRIVAIGFKNGHVFHHAGVDAHTMEAFLAAPSLGRFYNTLIKGQYPGQKMTGHCPKCNALGWVGDTCEDCGCAEVIEDPRKEPRAKRAV